MILNAMLTSHADICIFWSNQEVKSDLFNELLIDELANIDEE